MGRQQILGKYNAQYHSDSDGEALLGQALDAINQQGQTQDREGLEDQVIAIWDVCNEAPDSMQGEAVFSDGPSEREEHSVNRAKFTFIVHDILDHLTSIGKLAHVEQVEGESAKAISTQVSTADMREITRSFAGTDRGYKRRRLMRLLRETDRASKRL